MCLFNGTSEIQCGKQGENKGLNYTYKHAKQKYGGRDDPWGQQAENCKQVVLGYHISKKPDRKSNRPYEMSDKLNDEHQYHQRQRKYGPDRPDEMLEIAQPMDADAIGMGCQKNRDRHRYICIYVACRREKSWYESHEIANSNKEGYGCYQGEKMSCPVMADILIAEVEDRVDYSFHEILDAAGNKFY